MSSHDDQTDSGPPTDTGDPGDDAGNGLSPSDRPPALAAEGFDPCVHPTPERSPRD